MIELPDGKVFLLLFLQKKKILYLVLPMSGVSVIVCTFRRPEALVRCLRGLAAQSRAADEVLVVVRPEDAESRAALASWPAVQVVAAGSPGLVAARNAGLDALRSGIAVFCDDDTVAAPDWLGRIAGHFAADARLGGVGGRDRCHDADGCADERRRRRVGRLQLWGRTVGNHHLGHGAPREVDFLKGANMAFRAEAVRGLRFDARLRGRGAQADDDMAFSLAVRRRGWRLLYDPLALVEHFPAADQVRAYVARAGLPHAGAYADVCFNHALVVGGHLRGGRRAVFRAWAGLVGSGTHPGVLQALRLRARGDASAWTKFSLNRRAVRDAFAVLAEENLSGAAPAAAGEGFLGGAGGARG